MPNPESQIRFLPAMTQALTEARKWLGATSPNPPVGAAALDKAGNVLALAAHRKAGGAHAEAALIEQCREQNLLPRVHTLVVTLEPCNHAGRTPPCCDAILATPIERVVVGTRDPNPNVQGGGCDRLRAAGLQVIEGVAEEECKHLMHAFAFYVMTGKPYVTVKRAFNEHGSMIPPTGQKTFTSKEALTLAHRLRKKADALITGSGTILADNPLFTVRHVPDHPGKRRILAILDRRERISKNYIHEAAQRGLDVLVYRDLDFCFLDLAARGAQDVLVEAGPTLSDAVLASDFWAMRVDIQKGTEDIATNAFNPKARLPFDPTNAPIEAFLP